MTLLELFGESSEALDVQLTKAFLVADRGDSGPLLDLYSIYIKPKRYQYVCLHPCI